MNIIKLSLAAALVASTFVGCGSTTPTLTPQEQKQVSSFDVSQITLLNQKINKAINDDNLLVNAPISIELAKEHYASALAEKDKALQMAAYLAGEKALKHAYTSKGLVKKYLNDVADIDRRMNKAQTPIVYIKRYHSFQDDYDDLIRLIDEDKVTEALKDKKEVLENANSLYGDTMVYNHIEDANRILENMGNEDLDEAAPIQFEKAQKQYEVSRLAIKQNPDNTKQVKNMARKANDSAKYAQTLGKDVAAMLKLDKDEEEYESFFNKLHHRISALNPDETKNPILPYPIYEKINRLEKERRASKVAQKMDISLAEDNPVVLQTEFVKKEKSETTVTNDSNISAELMADTTLVIPKTNSVVEKDTAEKSLSVESPTLPAEETTATIQTPITTEIPIVKEVENVEETSTVEIKKEQTEASSLTTKELTKEVETVPDNTQEKTSPLI